MTANWNSENENVSEKYYIITSFLFDVLRNDYHFGKKFILMIVPEECILQFKLSC